MGKTSVPIDGSCDPRFEDVRQVFLDNFDEGELGAALVVYVDGSKVVDLWGGYSDGERSNHWNEDTLVCFYSLGKPLAALCVLQLVDRGLLELDAPVCRVWPEFAAAGKDEITVRQLLSHRAGLPALRGRLPEDAMLNWELMTRALAESRGGAGPEDQRTAVWRLLPRAGCTAAGCRCGLWTERAGAFPGGGAGMASDG
jgi:CubicO group peptidase (beta-lactamase class C family)